MRGNEWGDTQKGAGEKMKKMKDKERKKERDGQIDRQRESDGEGDREGERERGVQTDLFNSANSSPNILAQFTVLNKRNSCCSDVFAC